MNFLERPNPSPDCNSTERLWNDIKIAARIQFPFIPMELEKCRTGLDKNSNVEMCNADKDLRKENETTGKGGPTNSWDCQDIAYRAAATF